MEPMDVAGVLQEAGDTDSRAAPDPKCKLNIIPYTSTSIRFPYLCQGYHDRCVDTANNLGMGRLRGGGGGSFMLGYVRVGGGGQLFIYVRVYAVVNCSFMTGAL